MILNETMTLGDGVTLDGIDLRNALIEGQAAIQELALLKPTLALAISKLDKKQLKVGPNSELGQWALQAKQESNSTAIVFRAVKS